MKEKKRNPKGMGSFTENKDGTITHRKCVGYKEDGNRKTLTVTANSKSACIKKMKEKEAEWKKKREAGSISVSRTVVELCQMHLDYQVKLNELKPKSIDRRENTINNIAKTTLGNLQLNAVAVADVDSCISKLIVEGKYSPSSIEKVLDVLNAAYNWAIIRGELERNPVAPIKPALVKRIKNMEESGSIDADVDALSEEEKIKFIECIQQVWKSSGNLKYPAGRYGLLLLHTGMRVGEALALRWEDVDLEYGTINIMKSRSMTKNRNRKQDEPAYIMFEGTTKNEKARKITLTNEAIDDLKAIKANNKNTEPRDYVVLNRNNTPHTTQNFEKKMGTIYKNAGLNHLKGGVHILRKTFATEMYESGARVEEIAAYIGDLESTTRQYYIAIRKKKKINGMEQHIVELPSAVRNTSHME